jgi:hypothetical protein
VTAAVVVVATMGAAAAAATVVVAVVVLACRYAVAVLAIVATEVALADDPVLSRRLADECLGPAIAVKLTAEPSANTATMAIAWRVGNRVRPPRPRDERVRLLRRGRGDVIERRADHGVCPLVQHVRPRVGGADEVMRAARVR